MVNLDIEQAQQLISATTQRAAMTLLHRYLRNERQL
jgi:hypothetical protein